MRMRICVSELVHHWCSADSRLARSQWKTALLCNYVSHWLGASLESALLVQVPRHYLNSSWNSVHWKNENKYIWNLDQRTKCFCQEHEFRNVICKLTAILLMPWGVINSVAGDFLLFNCKTAIQNVLLDNAASIVDNTVLGYVGFVDIKIPRTYILPRP